MSSPNTARYGPSGLDAAVDDDSRYTQLAFDPLDGALRALPHGPSPDAVVADSIAEAGFRGPRFRFRVDNGSHQGGSHVHLYERTRGGYRLTNLCFTRDGDDVIAYTHCEGASAVTIDSLSRSTIKRLRQDGLVRAVEKGQDWTKSFGSDKAIARFSLYAE